MRPVRRTIWNRSRGERCRRVDTVVPRPGTPSTRPSDRSEASTLVAVARAMFQSLAIWRAEGMVSPSFRVPAWICPRMWFTTWT